MSLAPGTRIGPYQVTALLGAGGMGEVYRARDTKLHRDVALKVLLAAVAGDEDRLARFRREAQVLASLNHPNIAHIHGLEDGGATPALVMELVEGPTLAEILEGSRPAHSLAVNDALPLARQIAEALEAAHEQGIVHRDLKPANIKVRPDGTVKVLDFGLAKALSSDTDRGMTARFELSDLPTIASPARTPAGTTAGTVMGTAAYMSPEQARGLTVDRRTDIWAFGCVFYEMLAGAPVFTGQTTTDILAAVIQQDPDWTRLPSDVPPRIVALLRRCLQRNPKDRLRDIADARFDIEDGLRAPEARPSASISTAPATPTAATPLNAWYIKPAAAVVVGAALTAAGFLIAGARRAPETPAPAALRAIITLPNDTTLALDRGSALALSPDGRRLVYSGRTKDHKQLYIRSLDQFDSLPIASTDGAMHPFFSPDGQWVGFFADANLKKVSLDGGAPVAITGAPTPRGEAWGSDNVMLLTPHNASGLMQVSALGGGVTPATTLGTGELAHRWPRFAPDGKHIVFTLWNDTGWEPSRVAMQTLGEATHKIIVPAGGGHARIVQASDGTSVLVYARAEGLMAARFDLARQEVVGPTLAVLDGLLTNLSGGAHYDVSASGTLAYVAGASDSEYIKDIAWMSIDGQTRTPALRVTNIGRYFGLSPDGTRIVRANAAGSSGRDMWIDDLVRGTNTRITTVPDNFAGNWSKDGKWVAFSRGTPVRNIYRRATDGSDVEERLTNSANSQEAISFSPDGTFLAFTEYDPITGADIWILTLPPQGSSAPGSVRPFVKTRFAENVGEFSPDGKWIAYQSNESGRFEIYVRPFPESVRKFPISSEGGREPRWAPDGKTIYFRDTKERMTAATVEAGADIRVVSTRALFDARGFDDDYDLTPDGKRFLMLPALSTENDPTQIHLVVNWVDEVRKRLK